MTADQRWPAGSWPDSRILDLFGIELPIIQAPMANSSTPEMALAVCRAGGLGSIPCASLTPDQARDAVALVRAGSQGPVNLNFFCHAAPAPDPARIMGWRARLAPYYVEEGIDPAPPPPAGGRAPFDEAFCALVEAVRPEVVSFHFGLPEAALLDRVRAAGAKVISTATTVAEAVWLEKRGVDAVIAAGFEAGGHRGSFLTLDMSSQPGTFALVPQVVDAVQVPVIAAGGIADGRGIAAAFALGASAAQIGTAYLFSPEAMVSPAQRALLDQATDETTQVTNLFTGRPARGVTNRIMREIGPLSADAPAFPTAGGALSPLRARAEADGRGDYTNQWAGQAARLSPHLPAEELTLALAAEALTQLRRLAL
ncbi:MAG: NAD(P)H-dependent flavin oxidoreductase [Caulobacteraceae bacterium]